MYYLDYSNGWPVSQVIKDQGYSGVIRYVTTPALMQPPNPGNKKHINETEYRSHLKAGLDVWLVYQGGTDDADGGYALGQRNARRAIEGCTMTNHSSGRRGPVGYDGPIFFCNDRPELPNPGLWKSYLDGAASVLGFERVGAYGFANAMDAAVGHAAWFWQAGRQRDVRKHVHFWQDNTKFGAPNVGGIKCDRNLVLRDINRNKEVKDMPLTDADAALVANKVWAQMIPAIDGSGKANTAWVWLAGANMGAWAAANKPGQELVIPDDLAEKVTAGLLPAITQTLRELDGMSEEDADRFTEALARRLMRPAAPSA